MKLLSVMALVAASSALCRGADLPRSSPEAQGVDSTVLRAFLEGADQQIDAMNSFMLIRHGHVVAEGWWTPYDAQSPHSLYSLSKSFTSTAVGLAIADGKLSLSDPVLKFFPEDAPANPTNNLKAMRVSDLLRMSTGQQTEPPRPADSVVGQDVSGPSRAVQARHALSLQHFGNLHAFGHRSKGNGDDRPRLPQAASL